MTRFRISVNKKWVLSDEVMGTDSLEQVKEEILDHLRREGITKEDIEVRRIEGSNLSEKEAEALYHLGKAQESLCEIGMEADADSLHNIEKRIGQKR